MCVAGLFVQPAPPRHMSREFVDRPALFTMISFEHDVLGCGQSRKHDSECNTHLAPSVLAVPCLSCQNAALDILAVLSHTTENRRVPYGKTEADRVLKQVGLFMHKGRILQRGRRANVRTSGHMPVSLRF